MAHKQPNLPKIIRQVLLQVHPYLKISPSGLSLTQQMVTPIYQHIQNGTQQNMRQLACQVLLGEVLKHAMSEYTKVDQGAILTPRYTPERIIEYLIAEILELSGNVTRHNFKRETITPYAIYLAMQDDDELYAILHKSIPIFPYISSPLSEDVKPLVLPKSHMKLKGYTTTEDFKLGLEQVMKCIVNVYQRLDPNQLSTYADAIAKKAGRNVNPSYRGIQSLQYEILATIYAYSKGLQPTGHLSFETLLRAALVNPYLQGLIDLPATFLQCIPKVKVINTTDAC